MDNLINDIRSWMNRFLEITFTVVDRECNTVAYLLTKLAHN